MTSSEMFAVVQAKLPRHIPITFVNVTDPKVLKITWFRDQYEIRWDSAIMHVEQRTEDQMLQSNPATILMQALING